MLRVVMGLFVILHGLVHLLYLGQSVRLFELQPDMVWPDGSWLFSRILGDEPVRRVTAVALVAAAVAFVCSGLGILMQQVWWRPMLMAAAIFSSGLFLVLWDGNRRDLDDKGGIGVLINLGLLLAAFLQY